MVVVSLIQPPAWEALLMDQVLNVLLDEVLAIGTNKIINFQRITKVESTGAHIFTNIILAICYSSNGIFARADAYIKRLVMLRTQS